MSPHEGEGVVIANMVRRWRFLASAAVLVAASGLVGCSKPYEVARPDGFVELTEDDSRYDRSAYEYRASTADGVVIGIRAYKNKPKVDLALSVRALENRIRLGEGYALIEKKDASAIDGTKGTTLRFGHDEAGGAHVYEITVFVTEDWVYVVEAGGKQELFDKERVAIDGFLKSFDPK
ncbi:MAG: serine/threonine protein kinase [Polyangiaceae bacterium]